MLLFIDILLIFFLNPKSIHILSKYLSIDSWVNSQLIVYYHLVFWVISGLIFLLAMILIYQSTSLPKQKTSVYVEHKVIKGLRPFGLEDAEIFCNLQREPILRECLDVVTGSDFRFGILCGELGSGKTSFLRAGLWPRLLKHNHQCIYVKIAETDPIEAIYNSLSEKLKSFSVAGSQLSLTDLFISLEVSVSSPLVLIFDQFEQFFIHHHRKEDREPFIRELANWYINSSTLPIKILFCLREDFYGRLIELQKAMKYSLGPQQIMRLEKFTPREAAAVIRFISETEMIPIEDNFVKEIAENELVDTKDGLVSAVDIQILAWMIWSQRVPGERALNRSAFQKLGGVDGILKQFLSRSLSIRETEERRQAAIMVLLALIDQDQNVRSGLLSAKTINNKLNGIVQPEDVQEALDWLSRGDVRLVTPIEYSQGINFELAHERLIPAIRRLAGKTLSDADRANHLLEQRVNEWLSNQYARRYLLNWFEWRFIKKQYAFIVWGAKRTQKKKLLDQTHRYWISIVHTIAVMALLCSFLFGFFQSSWGQVFLIKYDVRSLDSKLNDRSLEKLANAWASLGEIEQAYRTANLIIDSRDKASTLRDMVATLSARIANDNDLGLWIKTHELANKIVDPDTDPSYGDYSYKRSAIFEVNNALIKLSNKSKSINQINQIIKLLVDVDDPENKKYIQSILTKSLVELGVDKNSPTLLEQAYELSINQSDPKLKAWHFSNVIDGLRKISDSKEVGDLIEQIHKAFHDENFDSSKKVFLLSKLARFYINKGEKARAKILIAQAEDLANKAAPQNDQDKAWRELAISLPTIGDPAIDPSLIEKAYQLSEKIDAPKFKILALYGITENLLELSSETHNVAYANLAFNTISRISDPEKYIEALIAYAKVSQIFDDHTRDSEVIDKIANTVSQLSDENLKDNILFSIDENLNISSQIFRRLNISVLPSKEYESINAKKLIDQLRHDAEGIKDLNLRKNQLYYLIKLENNIDDEAYFKELINVAKDKINKTTGATQSLYLYYITDALAEGYAKYKIPDLLIQAHHLAVINQPVDSLAANALLDFSVELTRLSRLYKDKELLDKALELVTEIDDPNGKADALAHIASSLATDNELTKASDLIKYSLHILEQLDPSGFAEGKMDYANTLLKIGKSENNIWLLKKSLELIKTINFGDSNNSGVLFSYKKVNFLRDLADSILDLKEPSEAEQIIIELEQTAANIRDGNDRVKAFDRLPECYAKIGDWKQARKIANLNLNDDDKAEDLASVLKVWAERGGA